MVGPATSIDPDLDLPVIGPLSVMPDGLDAPHWEGLAAGELRLQHCATCGAWIWAPQWLCPACHTFEPPWEAVEATGTIYTWTRTWHGFAPEVADHLPYLTVLVELPHAGGRRLLGLLVGDQGADPVIGEAVTGVIQPPSPATSGQAVLRWRREPQKTV